MRVELKLYKNYDADLISLNANGISVTMLMKKALEYYVRGQQITFVVPNAIPFTLKEKKRTYHLLFEIKDKQSVDFLKREIKEGWRTAFFKTLVRSCLLTPQIAVFFKNDTAIKKETERIKLIRLDGLENVVLLEPKKSKRITIDDILKPKKKEPVKVEKLPDYSTEDKAEVKPLVIEKPPVVQKDETVVPVAPARVAEEPSDVISEDDIANAPDPALTDGEEYDFFSQFNNMRG